MKLSAVIRELVAAGLSGDALVAAVERIEATAAPLRDEQAERRRAKDRERKARLRNSAESADIADNPTPSLPPLDAPLSPCTPYPPLNPPQPTPAPVISSARRAADDPAFLEFWAAYPRRVGKEAARRAWGLARKRGAAPDHIVTAAQRYAEHPPDDPAFIPHPATWLNGGRYDDEIQETKHGNGMGRHNANGAGQYRRQPGWERFKRLQAELVAGSDPFGEIDESPAGGMDTVGYSLALSERH